MRRENNELKLEFNPNNIPTILGNFDLDEPGMDYMSYLEPMIENVYNSFWVQPSIVNILKDLKGRWWEIRIRLRKDRFPIIDNDSIWNAIQDVGVFADDLLNIQIDLVASKFTQPNAFIVIRHYWD